MSRPPNNQDMYSERALSISRRVMRARFAAVVTVPPVGAVAVPEAILSDGLFRDQLSDALHSEWSQSV